MKEQWWSTDDCVLGNDTIVTSHEQENTLLWITERAKRTWLLLTDSSALSMIRKGVFPYVGGNYEYSILILMAGAVYIARYTIPIIYGDAYSAG